MPILDPSIGALPPQMHASNSNTFIHQSRSGEVLASGDRRGRTATALVTNESIFALELKLGVAVCVVFQSIQGHPRHPRLIQPAPARRYLS